MKTFSSEPVAGARRLDEAEPRSGEGGAAAEARTSEEVASRRYSHYVLVVLFLVYVLNFIDRQILSILVEPIKRDLGISDTQIGFLTGVAFALFYTFAGIPIARWADRGKRINVITFGLTVWSAMTALCGLARGFVHLALARIGVGIGEAAFVAPAHSLISDYYPPERRATAFAVFSMGIYVGIAFGFALGGWIAQQFGWRVALMAVGLPGLLMAVLLRLTIREPARGASETQRLDDRVESLAEVRAFLRRIPSFKHIALGAALHALGGYAFAAWAPAFYIRVYQAELAKVGLWLGLIIGLGGALGAVGGGMLADRLGARDLRWQVYLPALASLLSIPFLFGILFAPGETASLLWLIPFAALAGVWSGPVFAVVQGLVKLRMRALAAAILAFVVSLIGLGLGPLSVGVLNDSLAAGQGNQAVRWSLLIIVVTDLWAAGHFFLAGRTLKRDWEVKNETEGRS
ncbi:MAG: MFS transporter [Acidobacteriota bacterium]